MKLFLAQMTNKLFIQQGREKNGLLFSAYLPAFMRIAGELDINKKTIERFFRLIREAICNYSLIELK